MYTGALLRQYSVHDPSCREHGRSFSRFTVEDGLSFVIVLAILLAPIRFGIGDSVRPTTVVLLPFAAYLLLTNLRFIGGILQTRLGIGILLLMALLSVGHFLGNDVLESQGDDAAVLSMESLLGIPMVLLSGILLGKNVETRKSIAAALIIGVIIHIGSIAFFPSVVTYRQHDRMAGLLTDPNILLLHITPVFFLWQSFLKRRGAVLIAQLCLLAVVWATLQTLSRAGLTALAVGVAVQFVCVLFFARTVRERLYAVGLAIGVPIVLFFSFQRFSPEFVNERTDAYLTRIAERKAEHGSMLGDRMLWLNDIQNHKLSDHLLNPVGMGYSLFQKDNPIFPHNTFVDVYIIAGPFALLLYAILFFAALQPLITLFARRFKQSRGGSGQGPIVAGCGPSSFSLSKMAIAALCACLATEILLLCSLSVLSWKINWLILGILLGYGISLRKQNA
jgi:hypothetical protein